VLVRPGTGAVPVPASGALLKGVGQIVATRCEICGKGTVTGRNIRSNVSQGWLLRAPKTSRKFKANVRNATIMVDGAPTRVHICTRCLRTTSKSTT
jgi:large subunit ribosomal protein L28